MARVDFCSLERFFFGSKDLRYLFILRLRADCLVFRKIFITVSFEVSSLDYVRPNKTVKESKDPLFLDQFVEWRFLYEILWWDHLLSLRRHFRYQFLSSPSISCSTRSLSDLFLSGMGRESSTEEFFHLRVRRGSHWDFCLRFLFPHSRYHLYSSRGKSSVSFSQVQNKNLRDLSLLFERHLS